jgi:hypothetical protein
LLILSKGMLALTAISAAATAPPDAFKWEPLRTLLSGWEFTTEYAVSVGDASGRLFTYQGGNFTLKTQVPTGSTSKWPSAMMFAGLVQDGTVKSLDDPAHMYLDWWTRDARDNRSKVTLAHLLSFTSGFGDGHPGQGANTRAGRAWRQAHGLSASPVVRSPAHVRPARPASPVQAIATCDPKTAAGCNTTIACNSTTGDIIECAKAIYATVALVGVPGKTWSYAKTIEQRARVSHLCIVRLARSGTTKTTCSWRARWRSPPPGLTSRRSRQSTCSSRTA